jgi:hypothetical protein
MGEKQPVTKIQKGRKKELFFIPSRKGCKNGAVDDDELKTMGKRDRYRCLDSHTNTARDRGMYIDKRVTKIRCIFNGVDEKANL